MSTPFKKATWHTDEVIAKIAEMHGNMAAIARGFGVARKTVYDYVASHPTCQQALKDARESMLDNTESALYKAILAGEAWAVCFFLKTQGKGRGYVERQEYTGKDGDTITIKVVYDGTDSPAA